MLKNVSVAAGLTIIGLLLAFAIFGPMISPHDPNATSFAKRVQPPGEEHLLGTDELGRDVLTRLATGARVSLYVALCAVGIALVAGVSLGIIAGFYRGATDDIISRILDVLFAFPDILLAIAIVGVLGPGVTNAMIAIGIVYTPTFARITRGAVLQVREEVFVDAARAAGARDVRIMMRHVLPNVATPIIVETSLSLGFAVLAEAGLSFLGLGMQPPDPSWGRMLSEAREYLVLAPWIGAFPGLAIMVTVLGFNLLGDGLQSHLDPRLRSLFQRNK